MMTKNKSGFTLLEVIVVLIILGILASLGLVNFTKQIQRTKLAAEAFPTLGSIKASLDGCSSKINSFQVVDQNTINILNACIAQVSNSPLASSPNFTYFINLRMNPYLFYVYGFTGDPNEFNKISFWRDIGANGRWTTQCDGLFEGLC